MSFNEKQLDILHEGFQKHDFTKEVALPGKENIQKNLVPHFTADTLLVTDSLSAYRTVAKQRGIPLRQMNQKNHLVIPV